MATSTTGPGPLPEPNAGAFSPLQPSPVIQSTLQEDPEGERQSRAQKPRPLPRKDGSRPSDIAVGSLDPVSSLRNSGAMNVASGRRNSSPFNSSTSPSRLGKSSPRHLSPATSQIFERDVQESTTLAPELSPAIPSHITTEDHIPPVLEASSLAITDNYDPDEVEIVMHAAHQPAAATVAHAALGETHPSAQASHSDLAASHGSLPGGLSEALPPGAQAIPGAVPRTSSPPSLPHEHSNDERESTYGAVDPTDPRRLSFISFADVVNAEHAEMAQSQSFSDGTLPSQSSAPSIAGNRSPSPGRSPVQASPPRNFTGARSEASPVRGGAAGSLASNPGIIGSHGSGVHSELTIETMRQTLQKTGSNDPIVPGGGPGSQPMSATSAEDVTGPFGR
ncbi:MAG: hypothetical protein Q9162_004232 [Coniocarpon cinnabarinum]